MSLETDLKVALAGVAGGRIYPDAPRDNPTYPLVIYQQVGGQVVEFMEGSLADKDHARVQVVVWAKSRIEASSLARDIRGVIVTTLKGSSYGAPVSLYEEALKLYGARTDFSIWYTP